MGWNMSSPILKPVRNSRVIDGQNGKSSPVSPLMLYRKREEVINIIRSICHARNMKHWNEIQESWKHLIKRSVITVNFRVKFKLKDGSVILLRFASYLQWIIKGIIWFTKTASNLQLSCLRICFPEIRTKRRRQKCLNYIRVRMIKFNGEERRIDVIERRNNAANQVMEKWWHQVLWNILWDSLRSLQSIHGIPSVTLQFLLSLLHRKFWNENLRRNLYSQFMHCICSFAGRWFKIHVLQDMLCVCLIWLWRHDTVSSSNIRREFVHLSYTEPYHMHIA